MKKNYSASDFTRYNGERNHLTPQDPPSQFDSQNSGYKSIVERLRTCSKKSLGGIFARKKLLEERGAIKRTI